MKKITLWLFALFTCWQLSAQTTVTIGAGTNNATGGTNGNPIYRSSAASTFNFSQSIQLLTAADLATAGVTPGSTITKIAFYKNDAFTMAAGRTATMNIYLKNSSATALTTASNFATWTTGSTNCYTNAAIGAADFPAAAGWVEYTFSTPFNYTGGSIETAVDWAINTGTGSATTGAFSWLYTTSTAIQAVGTSAGAAIGTANLGTSQLRQYNTQLTYTNSPCTGTPAPGNTLAPATVCDGASVPLSLQNATIGTGVTYQWYMNAVAISGAISSTYTIPSLSASASYYCEVTCGGNTVASNPVLLTPSIVSALPWTEGFEGLAIGNDIFPSCWGFANTLSVWNIETTPVANTGANSLGRTWSTDGWAFTPSMALTAGTSYRFSYYMRTQDTTVGYDVTTAVGTGKTALDMTTTLGTPLTGYQGPSWNKFNFEFTPTATGNYTFGVHVVAPVAPNGINFDDFTVELSPTCPDQTGLVVGGVTATGANTSWDDLAAGGALGYEYAITTSATPPASGTATAATFYVASGLSPQTVYYLHVRATCTAGTFGNWATATFTTACVPLTTLPWTEGFETVAVGTDVFPTCWDYENTTGVWNIETFPVANTGANSLGRTWNTDGWAFTPSFTLTAGTSYRFSYYMRTQDTTVGYDVTTAVGLGQTALDMTTTLGTPLAGYQGPSWNKFNFEFTPTASGDYTFGIHVVAPNPPNGINFDDFTMELSPTCPDQTGLVVGGVTATGANTSWDDLAAGGALGYEYAITTSATPPASGTATAATFYVASGLSPQTVYYLHVRATCTAGTFGNWATATFTTACVPLTTLPWTEGFETVVVGNDVFPTCWDYENTTGIWNIETFPVANTGANSLGRTWSTNGWAFTPSFTLTAGTSYRFSYYMRTQDTTVGYDVTTAVGSGQTALDMTTTLGTPLVGYQGPSWNKFNFEFTPTASGDYTFGIHVVAPVAPNGINFDDFTVELSPTCPDQTGLVVGGVTSTGANTSWDDLAAGGALGYEYAITTSATPPASGTATAATFYVASGLSPQTVYYLHVRATCTAGTFGNWATTTFTTACAPVTTLPWLENFDAVTTPAIPQCWSEENGSWETSSDTGFNTPRSGLNYLRDNWSATNEFMWTPGFDLVAGTSYDFSSWIQGDGATSWTVDFYVNNAQNSAGATQLGVQYAVPGSGTIAIQPYAQVTRSFVPATSGTYYFAYRVNEPSGGPWYVAIDDVEVKLSPTTPPVCASNLVATPNSCGNFSNTLAWDVTPLASGYYITIGTTTGGTDIANAVNIGTNTFNFTGAINTPYFWTVVPYNASGSATGCVEQTFTTSATGCYCTSVPTSLDNSGITSAIVGGTTNAIATVTYTDLTAAAVIVEPGSNTNVQLTFSTGYTYDINIWIDFNNDFDFDDAGELVRTGIACTDVQPNTVDASFIMPLTATSGTHRMRIGSADTGQAPPNSCYSGTYGVTLDFTVDTTLGTNSFDTSTFVAYPNPVKDVLNLSYKSAINNVKVVNLLGQEVLNTKANTSDVQVDMSALSAGAYIVSITVEDSVHTIKVIKE